MIYLYKCSKCGVVVDIVKPSTEASKKELCEGCGQVMTRVYTSPSIKTGDGLK